MRFVSALVLALTLPFQNARSFQRVRVPVLLLLALAGWMAIQLLPLPHAWWTLLPGRTTIDRLDQLVGLGDVWRPITLSPMKTANALASLVVPLAALLLLALLDERGWKRLPWLVIGAGVASACFGIAQIMLPGRIGLYLYQITNHGTAVGLFANRNHNAVMLTIALLFCAVRLERTSLRSFSTGDLAAIVAAFTLFAGIVINASRTGLIGLVVVGVLFGVRAIWHWYRQRQSGGGGGIRLAAGAGAGAFAVALLGLFAFFGRSPAVARLITQDPAEGQRLQALPYVWRMVWENQPFGTGFGAFEQAYYMVEPLRLLGPRYLNNAHDDWLQFLLEGGIPALVILLAGLSAIILRVVRIARTRSVSQTMLTNGWLGIMTLLILALASLVDYPLRTPAMMLVACVALAMVFKPLASLTRGLPVAGCDQSYKTL